MKEIFFPKRMWKARPELKRGYEVVIVGGGSHGLATAYYLAKRHGITDVAILEKSYIGAGASGRNTTIIRSNYRTPEGAAFYGASVKLYEHLSADLDFNLMFSQHGHLTLAHSDRAMNVMQERAEVNQLLGIDSRVIGNAEVGEICPELDLTDKPTWPILGALYHPPGGIIRHDAVVWGFARGADRGGAEIHPGTDVTEILHENGRATGVRTNRGDIEAGAGQQAGQEADRQRQKAADRDLAFQRIAQSDRVLGEILRVLQKQPRLLDHLFADRSQRHPAGMMADEKRHADLGLDFGQVDPVV